jgi:hypothetical protein
MFSCGAAVCTPRRPQSGPCPDVLAVPRGPPHVAAPHPSGGAVAPDRAMAEPRWGAPLRPRPHVVPPPVRRQRSAARVALASVWPARGRGRTRTLGARQRRMGRSPRGGPLKRQGAGRRGLYPAGRAKTPPSRRSRVRDAGSSRACPVRLPAPPRGAVRPVGRSRSRQPLGA